MPPLVLESNHQCVDEGRIGRRKVEIDERGNPVDHPKDGESYWKLQELFARKSIGFHTYIKENNELRLVMKGLPLNTKPM